MYFDALVVGSGPGGCMAARTLSDAGFKVALLEREKIPRDKPCGGHISPQAAALIEDAFGAIPETCLSNPRTVRGARLLCEGGGEYELPFPSRGLSVTRSRLDAYLAGSCGAEVMDACEVTGLQAGSFHVTANVVRDGEEENLESTYLLSSDGADSLALRTLRPEFHRLYAAPRLERTMLVLSEGELEWDPEWMGLVHMKKGSGIARFFTRDGLVGLAVNYGEESGWREELEGLTMLLRQRTGLSMRGEASRQVSASNRMAAGKQYSLGSGCALLAGEAAGFLDPWGFGIKLALESGRVAAESLVESSGERITPYVRYRYRMQDILDRELRQRREFGGLVGDLDTSSLAGDRSRVARRDRRALKKRFSR